MELLLEHTFLIVWKVFFLISIVIFNVVSMFEVHIRRVKRVNYSIPKLLNSILLQNIALALLLLNNCFSPLVTEQSVTIDIASDAYKVVNVLLIILFCPNKVLA